MAQEQRSEKVAIVTVHGTNDQTPGEGDRKKWWEPESAFCQGLRARLSARGIEAEIVPHVWSGANSVVAREFGAEQLAKTIRSCDRTYDGVHVIGHSHGGNVATHAAELVGWGLPHRRQRMASLTTVGTPFFKNKYGGREVFGAIAFLLLTLMSAISLPIISYLSFLSRIRDGNTEQYAVQMAMMTVALLVPISLLVFFLVFPIALRGARRVARFRNRTATASSIVAIWHPNDEAIAFLKRMGTLDIKPLPPWSFFRGSRTLGITIAIWTVLSAAVLSIVWTAASIGIVRLADMGVLDFNSPLVTSAWSLGQLLTLLGVTISGALALFGLVFLAVRLIFGVADLGTMWWLNGLLLSRIRGMAFGNDGDQSIGEVTTVSHSYPTREVTLDGAYADRLRENASGAASALLERYRWALFTVDADSNQALAQLAVDTMTWKSLVHTTYFDHDEMVELVANQIASPSGRA